MLEQQANKLSVGRHPIIHRQLIAAAVRAHAFLMHNVVGYVHQELQTRQQQLAANMPVYDRLVKALQSDPGRLPTLNQLNLDEADLDSEKNFVYFEAFARKMIALIGKAKTHDNEGVYANK